MALDHDDPRPPYQQLSQILRAAILTKKLAPGDQLPSGAELAERYGVARQTVQQAIRLLRDDGLVVSHQGKGVFVRQRTARPVGIRPVVERAFQSSDVTIDFFGFAGETLHNVIQEPLDKIRAGAAVPNSITIRILLPDTGQPIGVPCRVEDLADDPDFRARITTIRERSIEAISESVGELVELGFLKKGSVELRLHRASPLFKLYILNGDEAFFGFYPVAARTMTLGGEEREIYDLVGKDSTLFHHAVNDEDDAASGSVYVEQAKDWFETIWTTIAQELTA